MAQVEVSPIYVRHKPQMNLVVLSTDAGNGKGEQTIMTLTPEESYNLGTVLLDIGKEYGGIPS